MVELASIAKKWSKEILLTLNEDSKGFNEIGKEVSTNDHKISSRTLADRLTELEKEGLIVRMITKTRPPRTVYLITRRGREAIRLTEEFKNL
ncbi:MAG: winged helix-turn-helix transcriptional regulator [Candidatus Hydrothermarchaeales archaeon]